MDAISLVLLCRVSLAFDASHLNSQPIETEPDQRVALRASGMWKGYRGSRAPNPGLRQHSDGFWYPKRAFEPLCTEQTVGPICGHVQWCRSRYWSYRSADDSFQPYEGRRRPCVSPLAND